MVCMHICSSDSKIFLGAEEPHEAARKRDKRADAAVASQALMKKILHIPSQPYHDRTLGDEEHIICMHRMNNPKADVHYKNIT